MRDIDKILKLLKKEYKGKKFFSDIHSTPYKVLISTILSQRTKDKNTLKAAKELFKLAKIPEQMIKLKTEKIRKAIKPAGFYKNKTKTIKEVSKKLIQNYNGKVPKNLDELLKLKGVGRKTANCVLLFGYKTPAIPVDTHVHRITNRIGLVKTNMPGETEQQLIKNIPKKNWMIINELFVRHGQSICLPINPKCNICPIIKYCNYKRKY